MIRGIGRQTLRPAWFALASALFPLMTTAARAQTGAASVPLPTSWISGYSESVRGQRLDYHAPLPEAKRSLLVRSDDTAPLIEWTTAPVPQDFTGEAATFVMLVGIDANEDRRSFTLSIDGRPSLVIENPDVAEPGALTWRGEGDVRAELRVTVVDRYSDAMGFLLLHVPRSRLRPGEPLRLEVTGERAGTRTWFMVFETDVAPGIRIHGVPAVVRTPNGPRQTVRIDALYFGESALLRTEAPGVV